MGVLMKKISKNPSSSARYLKKSVPHRTVGGLNIKHLNDFSIEYESYNERYSAMLLSLCHDVERVKSQPIVFNYIDELGKQRKHYPDFEVITTDRVVFYLEVKAIENLLIPKSITKYSLIAKEYYRQKIAFKFLTNIQIEVQPLFAAVKLLFRYINSPSFTTHVQLAETILKSGAMPITAFMEESQLELRDVYTLVAKRHLTFDLSKPLSKDAYISLPNKPYGAITLEKTLCSTRYGDLLQKLALGHQPTDQSLLAAAKTWRQSNNHPDVWGVVGGFAELPPLRAADTSGFLRDPKRRRAFAPGYYNPKASV
jgi:hypothetical protein